MRKMREDEKQTNNTFKKKHIQQITSPNSQDLAAK